MTEATAPTAENAMTSPSKSERIIITTALNIYAIQPIEPETEDKFIIINFNIRRKIKSAGRI